MSTRTYNSPLREKQAQQTRSLILDALVDLLGERQAADISTQELADHAGVSKRTVYRHFPDRDALVNSLTVHAGATLGSSALDTDVRDLAELPELIAQVFEEFDRHEPQARAMALLDADPRYPSFDRLQRNERWQRIVANAHPELSPAEVNRVVAVLRNLLAARTWLQLKEEFGLDATESGPMMEWLARIVIAEVDRGNLPEVDAEA